MNVISYLIMWLLLLWRLSEIRAIKTHLPPNAGPVHRHIYVALAGDDLKITTPSSFSLHMSTLPHSYFELRHYGLWKLLVLNWNDYLSMSWQFVLCLSPVSTFVQQYIWDDAGVPRTGVTVGLSLQWRHNERDGTSNHQPHECLLNRLCRRRSKKASKLRVTGLCAGNSPVIGQFPTQRASNAENVFSWWCHHVMSVCIVMSCYGNAFCTTRPLWHNSLSLRWRHNGRDGVSNHQPHDCLLNRLFRRRSKKTSKLRVTGLCVGNSPGTGEFPAQMASNAENVSIWWRHHVWCHTNWDV